MVVRWNVCGGDWADTCCAITRTYDRALELCGQYRQEMVDKKLPGYDFYVQGQTYYDE